MSVWASILGAVLGFLIGGFGWVGFFLGAIAGFGSSYFLKRYIQTEIKSAIEALYRKLKEEGGADSKVSVVNDLNPSDTAIQPIDQLIQAIEIPNQPIINSYYHSSPTPKVSEKSEHFSPILDAARKWIVGGNPIVRLGLVILFVGLSFLANYASSAGLFPVELRLALVALFGAGLLYLGFMNRLEKPNFGLALQGAGVATLYLTLFATTRFVGGFPIMAAFCLMIIVCVLGCALALFQRSHLLAATAFAGGFAVPFLLSDGKGDLLPLFLYYSLLNIAILFIAHSRSWRLVNLIGFWATFGLLSLLALHGFKPDQLVLVQFYLIISVLIYVAVSVFYAFNKPTEKTGPWSQSVDATLLFGTAIIGFGVEIALIGDRPFISAFAALVFAALYIGVAAIIGRRHSKAGHFMMESLLIVGLVFVALAPPMALEARYTSAAWALEGLGIFFIGLRQSRWFLRLFGIGLQILAALAYYVGYGVNQSVLPLINPAFVGALLIALAFLVSAFWLRNELGHNGSSLGLIYSRFESKLGNSAFLFGFAFFCLAFLTEAFRILPASDALAHPVYGPKNQVLIIMLAIFASSWFFQWLGRRLKWSVAVWPSSVSLLVIGLGFFAYLGVGGHALYWPDCLIWLIVIAMHFWMLFLNDHDEESIITKPLLRAVHIGSVWLGVAFIMDMIWLGIDRAKLWETSWAIVGLFSGLVLILIGLTQLTRPFLISQASNKNWPLGPYGFAYGWQASLPIVCVIVIGFIVTSIFGSADVAPLPYIPIINPVDLILALALVGLIYWRQSLLRSPILTDQERHWLGPKCLIILALLGFLILNTAWLRFAHHVWGVDWEFSALFDNMMVQSGLAILWTILALPLMISAHRLSHRNLWLCGGGLLALTVIKLIMVDLNNTGGGARIIAFIAVGVLMLVVGYIAPLPPRQVSIEPKIDD